MIIFLVGFNRRKCKSDEVNIKTTEDDSHQIADDDILQSSEVEENYGDSL